LQNEERGSKRERIKDSKGVWKGVQKVWGGILGPKSPKKFGGGFK